MKKIISMLLFSLILVACSREEDAIQPEEVQEPVTKIVHECQCPQEDETAMANPIEDETNAVDELQNQENEINVDADGENQELDSILPDVNENPEINNLLPDGIGDQESSVNHQVSTYTVVAGDTLTQIASRFGVTSAQIQSWNNLATADSIYIGQVLNILGGAGNVPVSNPGINNNNSEIVNETIEFLLNGQVGVRESEKLNWNPTFLQQINLEQLHQQFVATGEAPGNIEGFANFVTTNAPILENWEELFRHEFFEANGTQITNLTALGEDRYRAYIEVNGVEVPEVIVSARTGFYSR